MAESHYLDHGEQRVVIVMTSGPSMPHRCATPFYIGALLASMDAEVHIFLTMEGVLLAQRGVPENLTAMKGGKKIIEFMREAKAAGVRLHLCKPAMPGYELEVEEVIDEVDEISPAGALSDLILGCDKTMFF